MKDTWFVIGTTGIWIKFCLSPDSRFSNQYITYGREYIIPTICQCCSVAMLCLTLCNPMDCSTSLPCPSLSPDICSSSCLSSWWCYPVISSSVALFSSCLQSFPASGYFSMCQLFASGNQSIGALASASVLPMNIQNWFPLGLTGLISLLSNGLSKVFSSSIVLKHQFFSTQIYTLLCIM